METEQEAPTTVQEEEEPQDDTKHMVILFDPQHGVGFHDHNLDEAVAKHRVDNLRERRLPAFTLMQENGAHPEVDECYDCQMCREQFTKTINELHDGEVTLKDKVEAETEEE